MAKKFNVTGLCLPNLHYMVDITERLQQIKEMIDQGEYFTINRARQYGKTTTLRALADYLKGNYNVISLDFQSMDSSDFESVQNFVEAFALEFYRIAEIHHFFPEDLREKLQKLSEGKARKVNLRGLFLLLSACCEQSEYPVVLMIDEVDNAAEHSVFLDFLAQLRRAYLNRDQEPAFQSVILAGVYDIKNIQRKIRPESEHATNSPWNIASDYTVDMSFSPTDIAGMLREYERDYETGMDVEAVSEYIYEYTSGYPFLVSRICKLLDEQIAGTKEFPNRAAAWTCEGIREAVSRILDEKNPLFDSLTDKIQTYSDLRNLLFDLLMNGKPIAFVPDNPAIDIARMFGFVCEKDRKAVIANRIFETRLYNYFLSTEEMKGSEMYTLGAREKPQFFENNILNMKRILGRFVVSFHDLYGDRDQKFVEEDGRRYFLLYLRPIINGTGNYYIEARTRSQERSKKVRTVEFSLQIQHRKTSPFLTLLYKNPHAPFSWHHYK